MEKQLKVVVEDILAESGVYQQRKPGRRGKSEGGSEGDITDRKG